MSTRITERCYYCHCDECGVLPPPRPLLNQAEYNYHVRTKKFGGMKYAKWRASYSKCMTCK